MPVIQFEGQQYNFPEDASQEEITKILNNLPMEEEALAAEDKQEPLREQAVIKKDEGVRRNKEGSHIAYKDTEGHATGGRGHLLTKEERKQYPKDTAIPDDVVSNWFKTDMATADKDLTAILEEKQVHVPDDVFDILLNMSFNLGKKGLLTFKKMLAAVEVGDWATVAVEMEDSKWFGQVKNRAVRLVGRMEALAPKAIDDDIRVAP